MYINTAQGSQAYGDNPRDATPHSHRSVPGCCTRAAAPRAFCGSAQAGAFPHYLISLSPPEPPSALLVWVVLPFAMHATACSGSGCSQTAFARLRIPWIGAKATPADALQGSTEAWHFCSNRSAQKFGYRGKSCAGSGRGEGITSVSLNEFSQAVVSHTL